MTINVCQYCLEELDAASPIEIIEDNINCHSCHRQQSVTLDHLRSLAMNLLGRIEKLESAQEASA